MTDQTELPIAEEPEPYPREDESDVASRDSEIDFDDESDDDQLPIDEVEASEADALLDDPERLSEGEG